MNKKTMLKMIGNLDIAVSCVMLSILIIMTFVGVIMRYVVGKPFTWLEEVQLFCMVWIVFSAGGYAFRTGNHVAIEILVEAFPKPMRRIVGYFVDAVVIFTSGFLLYSGIGFVEVFIKNGRATSMLKIPMYLQYGIAPVSFVLMVISYIYTKYFMKKEQDGGNGE